VSAALEWSEDALCRDKPVRWFFPDRVGTNPQAAVQLCRACPVSDDCLQFALNTDGELYVDDGSGPVQLDNKMFDVVAQLGWASQPGSCGAKLGDLIDTLVAVAVFDDTQSKCVTSFLISRCCLLALTHALNISAG
jgi:hypothetical protein